MIDCQFQLNVDGQWQCTYCEWTYPRKSDKPPRRNCPAKRTPEQIAAQEAEQARQKHLAQHGPGAHLHALIKQITGEGITEACKCKSRIAEMNNRGCDWCRENTEQIIDWLIEEVDRRLKVAQDAHKPAAWRLRLGGLDLPGRRWTLRRLILLAVRRAERELEQRPEPHTELTNNDHRQNNANGD